MIASTKIFLRTLIALALVMPPPVQAVEAAGNNASGERSVYLSKSLQSRVVKIYGAGGIGGLESYQSGFFVSDQGHVLTSWSTVLDVSAIRVVTSDGRRYDATVFGSDPQTEIAVLKLELEGNDFFSLELPIKATAGMRVFAISNLFGIATGNEPASVQSGVVMAITQLSARRGRFKTLYQGPIIVTDAMTNNPGATGGVIVDLQGRAIGMLGKELRDEQAGIFMNYALPIDVLAGSVKRIMAGEVIVAKRNTAMTPAKDPHTASQIGIILVPDVLPKTPPFIDQVIDGSIAQQCGLMPNDLILLVNNQRIDSQRTLFEVLASINRNDSYGLLIQRGQELVQIEVRP